MNGSPDDGYYVGNIPGIPRLGIMESSDKGVGPSWFLVVKWLI